jgi:hypothetical protein
VSGDWTDGISVAVMARRLTPKQASRVKYRALLFGSADPNPRLDDLLRDDPGHRWFMYCLDAMARQEAT